MKILWRNRLLVLLVAFVWLPSPALAWEPEIGAKPKGLTQHEYLDGKPIDLSQFLGQPLVIYFGADWCQPCVESGKPAIVAMHKKYKDKGVKVLFVNMEDNKLRPGKIIEAEALGIPFAMAKLDLCPANKCPTGTRGDMGQFGKLYRVPTAIVLNAEGQVTDKLEGGPGVATGIEMAVQKNVK